MYEYYMFNKPAGYVTARFDNRYPVIMDFFKEITNPMLKPVGRLDLDTEGLIFISNDGKWNNHLMSPQSHISKKYFFWVLGNITDDNIAYISNGVKLVGTDRLTLPALLEISEKSSLGKLPIYARGNIYNSLRHNLDSTPITSGYITICEGKNHQVKRMLKAIGCYVIYLKRVKIGGVSLDDTLPLGKYRKLTSCELKNLYK